MKLKYRRMLLIILSVVAIIILTTVLINTYSKYRTSSSGSAEIAIARWNIKVNNTTIKNNSDLSAVITPIFPGTNDIAANIIAPTAEGYFDLALDYTEADVSFDYEITVTPNENSLVQDLVATGYSVSSGPRTNLAAGESISGTGLFSDATKTKTIRVFIQWDDANGTMNNAADTNTTIPANAKALLDVNISFIQNANSSSVSNEVTNQVNP